MEILTNEIQEVQDEPPEPPDLPNNWIYRMVSRIATYFSLRTGRKGNARLNYLFRKSFGIMGVVEFY